MEDLKERINKVLEKFNIEEKRKLIRTIEAESLHPDFWKDHKNASLKMKELSSLGDEVKKAEKLVELSNESRFKEAEKLLNDFETLLYFSNPYDKGSAIMSLHAGQQRLR